MNTRLMVLILSGMMASCSLIIGDLDVPESDTIDCDTYNHNDDGGIDAGGMDSSPDVEVCDFKCSAFLGKDWERPLCDGSRLILEALQECSCGSGKVCDKVCHLDFCDGEVASEDCVKCLTESGECVGELNNCLGL